MIKTGFCVAYDWEYLKTSIPRVYDSSDIICVAIDSNRKTWSGRSYEIDEEAFNDFIRTVDTRRKIVLYEDEFSLPELNARENCNRHRTMIAEKMGQGGWHVQVDADEYFLDFSGFTNYLRSLEHNPTGKEKPFNVLANWIPVVKKVTGGFLYVDFKSNLPESAPFATTRPNYERARHNGYFNKISPYFVIHETWARDEEQLWLKLNNWGHASEELETKEKRKKYFEFWKNLNATNYRRYYNVHPATPLSWPALAFGAGETFDEFIGNLDPPVFPLSEQQIRSRNNRNLARLRHLKKRLLQ